MDSCAGVFIRAGRMDGHWNSMEDDKLIHVWQKGASSISSQQSAVSSQQSAVGYLRGAAAGEHGETCPVPLAGSESEVGANIFRVLQADPFVTCQGGSQLTTRYGHISGMFRAEVDALLLHGVRPKNVFNKLRLKYRPFSAGDPQAVAKFMSLPSLMCLRDRAKNLRVKDLQEHEEKTLGRNKVPGARDSDTDDGGDTGSDQETGPSILRPMTVRDVLDS